MIGPQRYRKKPIEIDAMQWDGTPEGAGSIIDWINTENDRTAVWRDEQLRIDKPVEDGGQEYQPAGIFIKTLEGEMRIVPHGWAIRGVQGEFYPCKPDIFAATYDAVGAQR